MKIKYCVAAAVSAATLVTVSGCALSSTTRGDAVPATSAAGAVTSTTAPTATTTPEPTVITSVVTVTAPAAGVDPTCAQWWAAVDRYRLMFDKPDADEQEVLAWVIDSYLPSQPEWDTQTPAQHQQKIADAKAKVAGCHQR